MRTNRERAEIAEALHEAATTKRPQLLKTARRPYADPAIDEEDAVQEGLLATWLAQSKILPTESGGNPNAYITRAVVNKATDAARRKSIRSRIGESSLERIAKLKRGGDIDSLPMANTESDSLTIALATERYKTFHTAFESALGKIPKKYAQLIYGRYIEGKNYEELARDFHLSKVVVKSRLHQARLILSYDSNFRRAAEDFDDVEE